ncbi:MAG: DNA modification methylase [Alphaproteobacteria bacterium]|nr:MAG: DNA modification methylase [Alphaproteobacteria bacterium]
MTPPAQLTPYAGNARTHSEEQVAQIAASIAEFGFTNPILADGNGVIIAGHGRLLAAQRLGLDKVPVITLDHLTDAQRRALVIADNKIAENAGWDEDMLRAELQALEEMDFDLDLVGFSDAELDELLNGLEDGPDGGAVDGEDDVPETPEDPVTQPGDLWILGNHRLLCGDSTAAAAVARLMDSHQAVLLFTSPPYGQQRDYGAAKEKVSDWDNLMRGVFGAAIVAEDAQLLVNLGLVHRDSEWIPYWDDWIEWMRAQGWRRFGWYVWDQCRCLPGDWKGRYAPSHEFIFHFNRHTRRPNKIVPNKCAGQESQSTGMRKKDGSMTGYSAAGQPVQDFRIPDSVVRVTRHMGRGIEIQHPAVFPVRLAAEVIEAWSNDGDVLYEPFAGSGTQFLAATDLGRRCFGMELDPAYCDVAVRRWQQYTGEAATLEGDGRSFDEIAEAREAA